MCGRLRNDVDPFKWIAVGLLALLRDHDRPASLQGSYLPVDVQHLRFKKRRAIRCDDGMRIRELNVQRSTLNLHRSTFNENKREDQTGCKPICRDSQDG